MQKGVKQRAHYAVLWRCMKCRLYLNSSMNNQEGKKNILKKMTLGGKYFFFCYSQFTSASMLPCSFILHSPVNCQTCIVPDVLIVSSRFLSSVPSFFGSHFSRLLERQNKNNVYFNLRTLVDDIQLPVHPNMFLNGGWEDKK